MTFGNDQGVFRLKMTWDAFSSCCNVFVNSCFSDRSRTNPSSLIELVKTIVRKFSTTSLKQSEDKEAGFQHFFMEELSLSTTSIVKICPELSMNLQQKVTLICIWVILCVGNWIVGHGDRKQEHLDRDNGKYSSLKVKDYMDLRANKDGIPTSVKRHKSRITGFFILGDL